MSNRKYLLAALLWAIAGGLLFFFERPIWDALWIMQFYVLAAYVLVGLVILAVGVFRAWKQRWSLQGICAASSIPIAGAVLWFCWPFLESTGTNFVLERRFTAQRDMYGAIVAEVLVSSTLVRSGERNGIRYVVDEGPPVRIAFPQPGSILDNWEGVVYDATGAVLAARGWQFEDGEQMFTAPIEVRKLFLGDIVECEHIEGNFYRCWFT